MNHSFYMQEALILAEKGRGLVSPNPMVGAVVVKNHHIIGRGFHGGAGALHAEVIALQQAGADARDGTLYVTLEPCCHYGKTPPCVDAVVRSGVKHVYFACEDVNPLVSGKGKLQLQQAGIEVVSGIEQEAAKKLNAIFFHFITKKQPFVIAKWAMSLDGKTRTAITDDRRITDVSAQLHTHALRQSVDAILVGAETAIQDNPALTVRDQHGKLAPVKQPLRIIIANRELPLTLQVFSGKLPGLTWVVSSHASSQHIFPAGVPNGVEWHGLSPEGFLRELLNLLAQKNVTSLLVEGGMKTAQQFFLNGLVNRCVTYLAPCIINPFPQKKFLRVDQVIELGRDICIVSDMEQAHV